MLAMMLVTMAVMGATAPFCQDGERLPAPRAMPLLLLDARTTQGTLLSPHRVVHAWAPEADSATFVPSSRDIAGFETLDVSHLAPTYRDEILTTAHASPARLDVLATAFSGWTFVDDSGHRQWHPGEAAVRDELLDRNALRARRRTALDTMVVLRIEDDGAAPRLELHGGVAGAAWAMLAER